MKKTSLIRFSSGLFPPFLPDDSQVNPGIYGFELALWLSQRLAKQGIVTSYPNEADWGWYLDFLPGDREEIEIRCHGHAALGDAPRVWVVELAQTKKSRHDQSNATERVTSAILSALADEGIDVVQS